MADGHGADMNRIGGDGVNGHRLGIVAIGRNEGDRLKRCLRSIPRGVPVVYVDSASDDGSPDFARQWGAHVVDLDMTRPFTAARARSEGLDGLRRLAPSLSFVLFVDGDCEIEQGWPDAALKVLDGNERLAAICGRRREAFPDASFYNRLIDEEWDSPVGEADACGGDAVYRMAALMQAGGFDPAIVAGEEPELCQRLRAAGWKIRRIDAPMTIHDAQMTRFRQWWLRAVRCGFGYAQVWHKTRASAGDTLYGRELARAVGWTLGVPLLGGALSLWAGPVALLLIPLIWLAQLLRLSMRDGWRKGVLHMVGKFAETLGAARYIWGVLRGRGQGTIYYK